MERLGIISGTIALQEKGVLLDPEEKWVETEFGRALVLVTANIAFLPRHGRDPKRHILPHLINHPANLSALKSLGVREVIGINSTGSLRLKHKPGTLVVPDDFIMLNPGPTVFSSKPVHITPTLSKEVRERWIDAARGCALDVVDGGIYWQTTGPRFETKAEIMVMSQAADLVGMTMASEAIVARELDMAYASLCSVDNYAHGLEDKELTMEKILWRARRNAESIVQIVKSYIERRQA
ncbi:MAG: MTAP family purine nucleoside phosphorylase [Deltaproteobacteria bacterium]|nr:MTAP family purine nucleoside phosphorylase [Deltaproteobacteria bacterium]